MNNTIQELKNRKSVRVFTGEPISAEKKALILEAATQAPTAGNQQLYTIIFQISSTTKASVCRIIGIASIPPIAECRYTHGWSRAKNY